MDRWHGRHPIPWDFFYSVNGLTRRNLDWFWNAWYFQNNYIDIGVRSVARGARGTVVTLDNVGGMPAPVDVVAHYSDGTSATFHQTPAIWQRNIRRATVTLPGAKRVRRVELGHSIWMDADAANDGWGK